MLLISRCSLIILGAQGSLCNWGWCLVWLIDAEYRKAFMSPTSRPISLLPSHPPTSKPSHSPQSGQHHRQYYLSRCSNSKPQIDYEVLLQYYDQRIKCYWIKNGAKEDVRVPFLNWRIRQASLTPMISAYDQQHKQANQSLNTQSQQVVVCKGWFSGMKEDSSHFWGRNSCLPLVSRLPWLSIDSFDQLIRNFPANPTLVKKPIQFEISLLESWKSIILIMARQNNTKLWRNVKNMRLIWDWLKFGLRSNSCNVAICLRAICHIPDSCNGATWCNASTKRTSRRNHHYVMIDSKCHHIGHKYDE